MREIAAWAIEETDGGRKGKLITIPAPYWHAVPTGLFGTKGAALRYIKNSGQEHRLKLVKVKVTIERCGNEEVV